MSHRVGIIVEGPSDGPVVRALLVGTRIEPVLRIAGGGKILSAPTWMVPRMYAEGAERVVALKDSHCRTDIGNYRQQVTDQLGRIDGLSICIVVHAIESWLLADETAIAEHLGGNVKPVPEPEKHCRPEEELNHIFRLHGRSYVKRSDAPAIASRMRRTVVEGRCPSFLEFLKAVNL